MNNANPEINNSQLINLESGDLVTEGLTDNLTEESNGLFTEFNAIIVSALVLLPILIWTIK